MSDLDLETTAVMPRRECLARLALEPVGRLIVPRDDLPPGRRAGDLPVGRRGPAGPHRASAAAGDVNTLDALVFEVDRIEVDRRRGWSVVVECVARDGSPADATADDAGWLWLSIDVVRGRRLGAGAPPDPGTVW